MNADTWNGSQKGWAFKKIMYLYNLDHDGIYTKVKINLVFEVTCSRLLLLLLFWVVIAIISET